MLKLIFPPSCLLCERPLHNDCQPRLCKICLDQLTPIKPPHCSRCLMPFTNNTRDVHRCAICLRPGTFGRLYSIGVYKDGLADLIKRLKFRRAMDVAPTLGKLFVTNVAPQITFSLYDCLVAVPLHRSTMRKRGFNQSVLIGQHVARTFGRRLDRTSLVKIKKTTRQSDLTAAQRRNNVRGAFVATRSYHGESCLLIDDVLTTGATAEACAAALKSRGAVTVDVLTVARAV